MYQKKTMFWTQTKSCYPSYEQTDREQKNWKWKPWKTDALNFNISVTWSFGSLRKKVASKFRKTEKVSFSLFFQAFFVKKAKVRIVYKHVRIKKDKAGKYFPRNEKETCLPFPFSPPRISCVDTFRSKNSEPKNPAFQKWLIGGLE